jgi:hypothetical protein
MRTIISGKKVPQLVVPRDRLSAYMDFALLSHKMLNIFQDGQHTSDV